MDLFGYRDAVFDNTRRFRYLLRQVLVDVVWPKRITWCMLNPSTADEERDDPTIRRVLNFSRDWGYDEVDIVNLFAYRSTDPKGIAEGLERGDDMVGPKNDEFLRRVLENADLIIAAWGSHSSVAHRENRFFEIFEKSKKHDDEKIWCLGVNSDGRPKHPLYIPRLSKPKSGLLPPKGTP